MADETTIAQLAPTISAAMDEAEVREKAVTPAPVAAPGVVPPPQPKRIREAFELLRKHPELTDAEISAKVASMQVPIVATLRAELAAIKAAPATKTTAEIEATKVVAPVEEGVLEGPIK